MKASVRRAVFIACLVGVLTTAFAQFRGRRRPNYGAGPIDRGNVPLWPIDEKFAREALTFARIKYRSTGWERASYADPWFFSEFSEKKNYPLGFNILFCAMTH